MEEKLKLFLHIELRPWQQSTYEKPLLTFASSLSSNLIGTEMDNQSDSSIADLVIKLTAQTEKIFVMIRAEQQEPFGSTLKLLHYLLRNEHRIHTVVLSGNHEQSEKLLGILGNRFQKESDVERIKGKIREFALA